MKVFFFLFLSFFFVSAINSQDINLEQYLVNKELNPASYLDARNLAIQQNLPVSILLSEGILMEVLRIQDGEPVYSVIKNLLRPVEDLEILKYSQITNLYDLTNAEIKYGNEGNEIYFSDVFSDTKYILVPEWGTDNVISLDPQTGDVINMNYIPPSPGNLSSPKQARVNTGGFITVSDQITDLVQKYDTLGNFLGSLAPAGGVNTAILDNMRGHNYRPNGNLVVAVGSGANQNSVAEFDPSGNYIGQYIATSAGGLNSPFDILIRTSDVLVTGSSSDAAHKYDLNGNYISDFASGLQFPQQIAQFPDGKIAIAVFSTPSGLAIYDAAGTQLSFFAVVTGLRGVIRLGSGNYLVSNGTGIHEIEPVNGNFIRTVVTAANAQYLTLADYSIIPVELTSFTASAVDNTVTLSWSTATETNNSGFAIERSYSGTAFTEISFVEGYGTSSTTHSYSFSDQNLITGKYSYRLKQVDFDGSINYSNIVNVEVGMPGQFALDQNYPNPFNPSTTISYSVPFDANISLELYNMLGQKVKTLINGFRQAGRYQLSVDASDLSSGTYLYKLSSGDFSQVRKMTLIK